MTFQFGKMGLAALSLTAMGLLALPGGNARAQDTPPASEANDPTMKKVSLDLEQTNLYSALKLLFSHINANYFLDPSLKNSEVSVHLTNVPFKTVLDTLVKSTGLPITWKFEDNIYRIVPKEVDIATGTEEGIKEPTTATTDQAAKFVIISRDSFAFDGLSIAEALGGKTFSILPRVFDQNPYAGSSGGGNQGGGGSGFGGGGLGGGGNQGGGGFGGGSGGFGGGGGGFGGGGGGRGGGGGGRGGF